MQLRIVKTSSIKSKVLIRRYKNRFTDCPKKKRHLENAIYIQGVFLVHCWIYDKDYQGLLAMYQARLVYITLFNSANAELIGIVYGCI